MKNSLGFSHLKESFAVVLYSVIISDTVISKKERRQFYRFFARQFKLTRVEIEQLFEDASKNMDKLDEHIAMLKEGFTGYSLDKVRFMKLLNDCIICDGIDNREYVTFGYIQSRLF